MNLLLNKPTLGEGWGSSGSRNSRGSSSNRRGAGPFEAMSTKREPVEMALEHRIEVGEVRGNQKVGIRLFKVRWRACV